MENEILQKFPFSIQSSITTCKKKFDLAYTKFLENFNIKLLVEVDWDSFSTELNMSREIDGFCTYEPNAADILFTALSSIINTYFKKNPAEFNVKRIQFVHNGKKSPLNVMINKCTLVISYDLSATGCPYSADQFKSEIENKLETPTIDLGFGLNSDKLKNFNDKGKQYINVFMRNFQNAANDFAKQNEIEIKTTIDWDSIVKEG